MKKLLLIGAILVTGAISFADAKSDYENAVKLAGQKKVAEAVKVLEGVAKSSDAGYAQKANLELGAYYLQENNVTKAKPYLQAAWGNGQSTSAEAVEAARLLYLVGIQQKNKSEAEKYILWTDEKTDGKNADITSSLIIFYFDNNEQSKGTARYNKAVQSANKDFVAEVNYNIGQYYLTKNNLAQAKSYLQKAYTGASDRVNGAGILLAEIAINEKKPAEAEKYLLDMNTAAKGKNGQILGMLGTYYLQQNNPTKAEEYLAKTVAAEPKNVSAKILLLGIYEVQNNTAKITSTYNQLKSSTPKVTNKQIGTYFGSVGAAALSEKYLQKAITEDKDNSAKLILGQVYAGQGKKAEAVKILQEAVNNKVNGAAEVLKQVQAMK
ncbi:MULTISPECIES: lipopolysaccharide assembly protein LapB [unclassified Leptotrichia]|jgi:putative tetratricopeptide repeat-containing domain protein|uniref:tetratricopeptide repeat protein n=1 Tax=unclassified Leptotrichia TaxID=2633022 RepID=UPI0003AE43D0|nr:MULTISPECIES: tetratricopeptide repeat protein [unclassified Leptotrichia]ERL25613.1 tetratricopeptide repeat protein [Leptotrichia sp. oral taxon 225 str. F0581]WLD74648.1 tetratricopeptide repeat protein [Leptotrichia sp. HMT-225]